MAIPSEARKSEKGWPSRRHSDLSRAGMAFVHDLREPLAEIETYLEGPICRYEADNSAVRQVGMALVRDLCEPLAAIENYLEAFICLHKVDTPAARIKLGEVCEKSQTEIARVNETLRQLRDLLLHERTH